MKNKGIILFLIVLAVVIVGVMVGDWYSKRPDNMEANKFRYSVDEFRNVPEELIHYKETKNFRIGFEKPAGITVENEMIYVVGDSALKIIDKQGDLKNEIILSDEPHTVEIMGPKIYIAFEKEIVLYNTDGTKLLQWKLTDEDSYITALASTENELYVADAGTRKIKRFTFDGKLINDFEGKVSQDATYGFIVPSPYFDIDINEYGDLWVVNPGMHTMENYTAEGHLREHWKVSGAQTENFSGCCNPAHFCFLPNGSFITSEKGLVRVKEYKPSGEFFGVVAAPIKFETKIEGQAPDVAVDNDGNIYALDFDKNVLRVFELK